MPGGARVSDEAVGRDRASSRARYHRNRDQNQKVQKAYRDHRLATRPFIGWDGEGYDEPPEVTKRDDGIFVVKNTEHRFMLFGASTGDCVTSVNLSTTECLELILQV